MVDSISGAGKPVTNINDIYVNWKKLTADEVLKYEKQGQEVPDDILKWAEEMAKIANAPEDITYEATNGSTDLSEITQAVEDNPNIAPSAAQADRQAMQDDGASLKEQGRTFINKSKEASTENIGMMIASTMSANSSQNIAGQAEANAAITEAKTQSIKKEYDALMEKAQDQNGQGLSRAEQTRLVNLGQQLNKIGTSSQDKLQDMSLQVDALDNAMAAFENIPSNALDYGAETVNIGLELLGAKQPAQNIQTDGNPAAADNAAEQTEDTTAQADVQTRAQTAVQDMKEAKKGVNIFSAIFNSNIRLGLRAGNQGTSTISVGNKGQEKLDENKGIIQESETKIDDSQKKVADATLVEAKTNNNTDNKTTDETQNDGAENPTTNAKDNTANDNDKQTLADTTITTDPNEIIKRKERKGIQT